MDKGVWILTEQDGNTISVVVFKSKRACQSYLKELTGWTDQDVKEAMDGNQVYESHVRFAEFGNAAEIPQIG